MAYVAVVARPVSSVCSHLWIQCAFGCGLCRSSVHSPVSTFIPCRCGHQTHTSVGPEQIHVRGKVELMPTADEQRVASKVILDPMFPCAIRIWDPERIFRHLLCDHYIISRRLAHITTSQRNISNEHFTHFWDTFQQISTNILKISSYI